MATIDKYKLSKQQIYNCDESGLYWKSVPTNTLADYEDKKVKGRKISKERVSIMCCANASGSHRCKPMVVGHFERPQHLRAQLDKLPVIYKHSPRAWFNTVLFTTWFKDHFVKEVIKFQTEVLNIPREEVKALLIMDNASMRSLLGNNRINTLTRVRALKTYIWSTLMYGSESWTLSRGLINKLNAAEMWFYRRMLRISWTDRITNEEVLRRIGMQRTLVKEIRKRQMNFLGHILRKEKIEHLCLTGKIEGRRARGRQRKKYLDSILEDIGENLTANQLIQLARDRLRWRQVIANVQDTALR